MGQVFEFWCGHAVADPEMLKARAATEDNASAPSSFITNAHNELYACFIQGKCDLLKKLLRGNRGGHPHRHLNPPRNTRKYSKRTYNAQFVLKQIKLLIYEKHLTGKKRIVHGMFACGDSVAILSTVPPPCWRFAAV